MRDPRTKWVSPSGKLAIAQMCDVPVGVPRSPSKAIMGRLLEDFREEHEQSEAGIARLLLYSIAARDAMTPYYAFFRRTDLPWEKADQATSQSTAVASRQIADYPKTCKLCSCPAYLGLNEVSHDPKFEKARGCRGLVDA